MTSSTQYGFPSPPCYEHLKEDQELGLRPPPCTVLQIQQHQQHHLPPVHDHFLWSLFTTLYLNFCCLGLLALNFSVKARDCKVVGDHSGASSYGSTAKYLNLAALFLCILMVVLFIILIATGSMRAKW